MLLLIINDINYNIFSQFLSFSLDHQVPSTSGPFCYVMYFGSFASNYKFQVLYKYSVHTFVSNCMVRVVLEQEKLGLFGN